MLAYTGTPNIKRIRASRRESGHDLYPAYHCWSMSKQSCCSPEEHIMAKGSRIEIMTSCF